jgi:putative membrane protein
MTKLKSVVSMTFGALLCAGVMTAFSQAGGADQSPGFAQSVAFATKATVDGMTEIQLGKLAQSKSQSSDVKAFGDRMVKDHGKANAELSQIAGGKSIPVPTVIDKEHAAIIEQAQAKSGADFDSWYAHTMVDAHKTAIGLFKHAASSKTIEPALADFAKKTLPVLQQHLKMADALAAKHSSGA